MTAVTSADTVLARRPDLATLVVTGEDRLSWLQGVVTCDVSTLSPGLGRWGLVLTKPGKILADVLVIAAPGRVLLGVPAVARAKILDWLSHHLIMEDAEVADVSSSFAWASLHGPGAATAAAVLAEDLGGVSAAVELTGLGDAMLAVPAAHAEALGAHPRGDVRVIDAEDWLRLRIERALPLYGVDMTEEQNPHDVSLERRAVSWDKGCYLGQEAVCMQDMRGKVKRRLVVLALASDAPPGPGTPITDATGATVGDSRSAAAGRAPGEALALAVVRVDASEPGSRLTVGAVPAVVCR